MGKKRIQLTLFVDENESELIEKIRREFNPEQYELIKSHVTLCREDELAQIDTMIQTITALNYTYITIDFGHIERFSDGKGVLIPAVGNNEEFQQLRKLILQGVIENPRKHEPHITLMHPRNSTCTDSLFDQLEKLKLPDKLEFKKISLIEQEEGNRWTVLKEFGLTRNISELNKNKKR